MAITVKDSAGVEREVAGKGAAYGGLITGIIGSSLGLLNSGGLTNGGLLGGGNAVTQAEANVGIVRYFEDRIADLEKMNAQFTDVREQICNLRERVSINETANSYQNRIVEIGFGNVDTRFATERQVTDFEIQAAVCDFVPAQKLLRPEQIADPYHGVRLGMGYVQSGCGGNCNPCNPCYGGF